MTTLGKRGAEDAGRPNKRARQRVHLLAARQIDTLPEVSASSTGEDKKVVKLPTQIQVDKYVSSYAFEIRSLQHAIKTAAAGSSIRAWQMLPRHKRRRNASHNLLALPRRLRAKGRAELRASKTTPRSRAEMRKRRGRGDRLTLGAYPRRRESVRRRELIERATRAAMAGKGWLETHLWHSKRFRMSAAGAKVVDGRETPTPYRWGFTLAEESSMKSHRSTWRDHKKGATIMDVSYDAWIRVSASVGSGEEEKQAGEALARVLSKAGLPDGWQEKWRDGRKCCKTTFTVPVKHGLDDGNPSNSGNEVALDRCLGPAQIVWLACDDTSLQPSLRKRREVLIRTHPAAASRLERSVRTAVVALSRSLAARVQISRLRMLPNPLISAGSSAIGRRHGKGERKGQPKVANAFLDSLQKKWNRAEAFNAFELGGPGVGTLLAKVLRPINAEDSNKLQSILLDTLADGTMVPLDVHDPRLSFPPRKPIPTIVKKEVGTPTSWSPSSRLLAEGFYAPTFCKGEIDSRRSRLATPGARLLPTSKDDIVPVVIIAHKHALTLLVPRGWGRAFWLSLVNPGTRVIGQMQSRALNFDSSRPTFPFDWAGTSAFARQEETESLIASDDWQRKPPAKRCNFDKVGVRWPFGGPGLWIEVAGHGCKMANVDDSSTDPGLPWMLSPSQTVPLAFLVEQFRAWRDGAAAKLPPPQWLLRTRAALICVKVTACRKGAFAKWDEIHSLDKFRVENWRAALMQVQGDAHSKSALRALEQQRPPLSATQIGSITTANFCLSRGKATAIASISLLAYLDIVTSQTSTPSAGTEEHTSERNPIPLDNLVLIKSVHGGVNRAASLQAVSLI